MYIYIYVSRYRHIHFIYVTVFTGMLVNVHGKLGESSPFGAERNEQLHHMFDDPDDPDDFQCSHQKSPGFSMDFPIISHDFHHDFPRDFRWIQGWPHLGLPDVWDFDFMEMSPEARN